VGRTARIDGAFAQLLFQGVAFDILRDEETDAVFGCPRVVQGDNAAMFQARDAARLTVEPLRGLAGGDAPGALDLQGDDLKRLRGFQFLSAKPLLVVMVIPLAVGFALGLSKAAWVGRLLSVVRTVSNVAMVLLVVLMVGLNFKTLLSTLGSFAIGTYMLYLFIVIGSSYLVGAIDRPTQNVFALGAGSRNIPACLVIAGSSLSDPAVTVMLIVAFVISLVGLLGLARVMRPKAAAGVTP
jgi:hypothetical protein